MANNINEWRNKSKIKRVPQLRKGSDIRLDCKVRVFCVCRVAGSNKGHDTDFTNQEQRGNPFTEPDL